MRLCSCAWGGAPCPLVNPGRESNGADSKAWGQQQRMRQQAPHNRRIQQEGKEGWLFSCRSLGAKTGAGAHRSARTARQLLRAQRVRRRRGRAPSAKSNAARPSNTAAGGAGWYMG